MEKPFRFLGNCPLCDKPLFVVDLNGFVRKYNDVLSSDDLSKAINSKALSHMQCNHCNTKFIINWEYFPPIPINIEDINYASKPYL